MRFGRTLATIIAISAIGLAGCNKSIDNLLTQPIQVGDAQVAFSREGIICPKAYILSVETQTISTSYVDEIQEGCKLPEDYRFAPEYVEEQGARREVTPTDVKEIRGYVLEILLHKTKEAITNLTSEDL